MLYRKLGNTGISVSELGFGAWAIGGSRYEWSYGPTDDNQSLAAIDAALEFGCTTFDTADVNGRGHSPNKRPPKISGHLSKSLLVKCGRSIGTKRFTIQVLQNALNAYINEFAAIRRATA